MMNKQNGSGPHGHGRRNQPFGFELFDVIFNDMENLFDVREIPCAKDLYNSNFPPANVMLNKETKDLTFEFALAGYGEDDISLSFDGDKMYLELQKTEKKIDEEKIQFLHRGLKTSSQKQWYFVPFAKYQTDAAKAEMKNGILKVTIPFKEEAKPKKVKINLIGS